MSNSTTAISLFIPCLIDQVYPEMGTAMARVLRKLGHEVKYNSNQTCCGQPAFNAGHHHEARQVAQHFLNVFAEDDLIVCPSGSCTAMVRNYYARLFEDHSQREIASAIQSRVFEFSEFLNKHSNTDEIKGTYKGRIGFHNSCHSFRELRLRDEPLALMRRGSGYEFVSPEGEPVCCGFGGLFSFKFAPIAEAMAESRLDTFAKIGADTLVSNDPGCIMHMRQEAKVKNMSIRILHLAEFLDEVIQ